MAKGQKSRKQKISKGMNRGSKSVALSTLELALLGKGLAHMESKTKIRNRSRRSRSVAK